MPGAPRRWPFVTTHVNVEDAVDHLVVVSDLHGVREPLDALDDRLSAVDASYRVFVNGDLFEGGIDPEYALAWAQRHAPGRTTLGNHEGRIFAYRRGVITGAPASLWARDGELGAYESLSDAQLRFVEELPDVLLVLWRGLTIRILHGHHNLNTDGFTPFLISSGDLMDLFGDAEVDMTIIAHTHYPFVMERDGARLANSGSISAPLCRFHGVRGQMVNRCPADETVPDHDIRSSFLSITEVDGRPHVTIERFDYDRTGHLTRCEQLEGLKMPIAARRKWVHGVLCDACLMSAAEDD